MLRFAILGISALGVLAAACAGDTDEGSREAPLIVDVRPALAESDQQPAGALELAGTRVRDDVVATARGARATFAVTADGTLLRIVGKKSSLLLDRASGRPAALADGGVVVARRSDEPGESDLWLVPETGAARALAAAPGPDDLPIAIPDGRIAFVSARTSIASLWIVDPKSGETKQLTNHGLVAGKARHGFVPPPEQVIEATDTQLVYDAGGGALWRVELASGAAQRTARGAR